MDVRELALGGLELLLGAVGVPRKLGRAGDTQAKLLEDLVCLVLARQGMTPSTIVLAPLSPSISLSCRDGIIGRLKLR